MLSEPWLVWWTSLHCVLCNVTIAHIKQINHSITNGSEKNPPLNGCTVQNISLSDSGFWCCNWHLKIKNKTWWHISWWCSLKTQSSILIQVPYISFLLQTKQDILKHQPWWFILLALVQKSLWKPAAGQISPHKRELPTSLTGPGFACCVGNGVTTSFTFVF